MPDTFTHTATTPVPPSEAWAALQRPEVWQEIAGVEQITDPRHDPSGMLMGFRFVVRAGTQAIQGKARTVSAEAPSRFILGIESSEITGGITAQLEPNDDDNTFVTVSVEMQARGALASLFYPVVARTVRTGLPAQVEAFAAKLGS